MQIVDSNRPQLSKLNVVPMQFVASLANTPIRVATMSEGQWDVLLNTLYNQGFYLLELDENENPVAVYWNGGEKHGND